VKKQKCIKSVCQKVWLFDVEINEDGLKAGLACYLAGCDSSVEIEMDGKNARIGVSPKAVSSQIPLRVLNARLPLLVKSNS
jgi:hypothetical protein